MDRGSGEWGGNGGNPFFLRRQSAACRREGANSTEEGPTVTFISSPCLHVTFMRYHKLTKTKYFLVHRKYENMIIGLSSLEYHRNKRIQTEEGNGGNTQRGFAVIPVCTVPASPPPIFRSHHRRPELEPCNGATEQGRDDGDDGEGGFLFYPACSSPAPSAALPSLPLPAFPSVAASRQ